MNTAITALIVNWNSAELVEKQVEKLHTLVAQIIIVDNGSQDSCAHLEEKYTQVFCIKNKYNHGFSFAINQGMAKVTTDWLFILNPDVLVTESTITDFFGTALAQNYDAVSIKSNIDAYSKPVPSVLSLLTEFSPLNKIIPQTLFQQKTLVGGMLLIKKSVLQKIGGFDERFFLWFEDSDVTQKLLDSGFSFGFCVSNTEHIGGFSLKKLTKKVQNDIFFTSLTVYAKKYFSKTSQKILQCSTKRFSRAVILPTMNPTLTSVIVPNMKKKLLDSFLTTNYQYLPEASVELIIVTSALSHLEFWQYKMKYPHVRFIILKKNIGFAKTVNIGLRTATGAFLGTCNDDVTLSLRWHENLLSSVLENKGNKKIGSINPIIKNSDGSIETVGIHIQKNGKAIPLTSRPPADEQLSFVDATNGACVLYPREALQKVGLFDERFGSYLEDIDLSLRLKKYGYENIVVNSVEITHTKHQTSSTIQFNKSYHDFKNWILLICKNWSLADFILYFPAIVLERGRNFSGVLKNKQSYSKKNI